jgi:hypothetical protein
VRATRIKLWDRHKEQEVTQFVTYRRRSNTRSAATAKNGASVRMSEQDTDLLEILIGQMTESCEADPISAKRRAHSDKPGFSSQSSICCIAVPFFKQDYPDCLALYYWSSDCSHSNNGS